MPETYIRKGPNGWRAETNFPLEGKFSLKISTSKRQNSGYLVTYASVHEVDGNMETHRVYQDYHMAVKTTAPKRVTDKAVEKQHAEVLQDIEQIKADALAHYPEGLQ